MAENLLKKSDDLMEALVKDVRGQLPVLKKLKAMAKLAKDIGEEDLEIDQVLEAAEGFSKMVIDRFEKKSAKE